MPKAPKRASSVKSGESNRQSLRSSRNKGRKSKKSIISGTESQASVESDRATRGSTESSGTLKSSTSKAKGQRKSKRTHEDGRSSQISAASVQETRKSTESSLIRKSLRTKGLRAKKVSDRGRPESQNPDVDTLGAQILPTPSSETPISVSNISQSSLSNESSDKIQKPEHGVQFDTSMPRKSANRRKTVTQIRQHLRASQAGQIILRSADGVRRFVSELEPFLPGQKFRNVRREKWHHEWDSTFSLIAAAVGTSNLSRFPYFCYTHGGSAFLIPYFIFLIFSAFPLLYMELLLGQFVQQGIVSVWNIVPIFRGIGYCIGILLILINSYYLSSMAWSLIFIWESISAQRPLPWTTCNNLWNTVKCTPLSNHINHSHPGTEFFKGRVLRYYTSQYADSDTVFNKSGNGEQTYGFASDNGLGNPVFDLSMCLLFVSLCLYLLVISDIRITGKFVWFTSITPLIILVVLLIESFRRTGASTGIKELIAPNFTHLMYPQTWAVASIQVFYSVGAGAGIHLTHASHNKFHHNVFRDAIITVIANSGMSLIGALVVFANIGNLAKAKNTSVSEEASAGNDLIFESFAEGIGLLESRALSFSIMFYSMIFLIGIDTALGVIQAITTGIKDAYPKLIEASPSFFLFAIMGFTYVFNLTCLTRGGIWMYHFMDTYAAGISMLVGIFFQTVVITWIWGLDELCDAAIAMTGRTPGLYLRLCWKYIAPLSLIGILVVTIEFSGVVVYDGKELPQVGKYIGNTMAYLPFVSIPIYFVYYIFYFNKGRTFKERIRLCLSPETEHADILAHGIGNSRDRLTWKHFFYLGGLRRSSEVSPEEHKPDLDQVISSEIESSRRTDSEFTHVTDSNQSGPEMSKRNSRNYRI